MRVFICIDHDTRYHVGAASVIVARNFTHAEELLDAELVSKGLKVTDYELIELDLRVAAARILNCGIY